MTDSEGCYNAAIAALRLIVVTRGAIPRLDEPIDLLLMHALDHILPPLLLLACWQGRRAPQRWRRTGGATRSARRQLSEARGDLLGIPRPIYGGAVSRQTREGRPALSRDRQFHGRSGHAVDRTAYRDRR